MKPAVTYPDGDHIVFKQEYWDHPIRKTETTLNELKNTTNITKLLLC